VDIYEPIYGLGIGLGRGGCTYNIRASIFKKCKENYKDSGFDAFIFQFLCINNLGN